MVVNEHVITEQEVASYSQYFAVISGNVENQNNPNFRDYVVHQMVTNYLLSDFADMNQLDLSPEEETSALQQVMESNGKKLEDLMHMQKS